MTKYQWRSDLPLSSRWSAQEELPHERSVKEKPPVGGTNASGSGVNAKPPGSNGLRNVFESNSTTSQNKTKHTR